ncbi:unnamed protein product [Parnassius mnemosyne]|uniref:Uncharacterized protein n=1 Tax=Parnassius mnemosyne TaxID=213953 RepID=A0AAV1LN04_9NEOP
MLAGIHLILLYWLKKKNPFQKKNSGRFARAAYILKVLWAKVTTRWTPINDRRGRPRKRWRDELDSFMEDWSSITQNRERWKEFGKAFAQQWDVMG